MVIMSRNINIYFLSIFLPQMPTWTDGKSWLHLHFCKSP